MKRASVPLASVVIDGAPLLSIARAAKSGLIRVHSIQNDPAIN
jgi:hypothetical protein